MNVVALIWLIYKLVIADVIIVVMKFRVMTLGKVYLLNTQTIGRFLRRVELLVCYRCGAELVANQWVYAKASRGDTSPKEGMMLGSGGWQKSPPKIYHLACAKEVKLV